MFVPEEPRADRQVRRSSSKTQCPSERNRFDARTGRQPSSQVFHLVSYRTDHDNTEHELAVRLVMRYLLASIRRSIPHDMVTNKHRVVMVVTVVSGLLVPLVTASTIPGIVEDEKVSGFFS